MRGHGGCLSQSGSGMRGNIIIAVLLWTGFALAAEPPFDLEKESLRLENLNIRMQMMEIEYPKLKEQRDTLKAKIEQIFKESVEKTKSKG